MELSSPKLKKLLIFQEKLPKPQKVKYIILLQKKVMNKFFQTHFQIIISIFSIN